MQKMVNGALRTYHKGDFVMAEWDDHPQGALPVQVRLPLTVLFAVRSTTT
jgi:hypothetical protein